MKNVDFYDIIRAQLNVHIHKEFISGKWPCTSNKRKKNHVDRTMHLIFGGAVRLFRQ